MPMGKTSRSLALALFMVSAWLVPCICSASGGFNMSFDLGFKPPQRKPGELQHARADQWRLSGRTLFVRGNVYIPYGNMIIRADSAMVDLESRDIEAKGNISFSTVISTVQNVTLDELEAMRRRADVLVNIQGISVDPLGGQKLKVEVLQEASAINAERMSGNLLTGNMTFTDLRMKTNTFFCKAKRGIRQPGGEVRLEELEVSNCCYLPQDQSHLSFSMSTANIYPHETEGFGLDNMEKEHNQYSLWGYNTLLRIYGVPVFWLPMIYAPKDESPSIFSTQIGKSGDWGFYVLATKKFRFLDYPDITTSLDLDYYSRRGLGYGERTRIATENSQTELNAYSIYDHSPYKGSGDKDDGRFYILRDRFDFQLTHRTHLSPRLDFRAQAEWMSDPYMLDDYFSERAGALTDPASYAALEYQADRYSASIYSRFRVNNFFTTVQKLPELRLDVPRQEIIPGWNIYYQGAHSADYMRMSWAKFDRRLKNPKSRLKDYETGRFDSVNFLYFPLRTDYFNIVPRMGLRMTGYTNSSTVKLSQNDLFAMQVAADEDDDFGRAVKNYNDHGDGKFRVIAEFGVEANTKIYNTWQNIRSEFLGLDGLRHICEPYINYTYITDPSVNRDRLLFFDDIDRITELNFLRMGVRNRLQTRRGGFNNSQVYEWFSMENYWDIYFNDDDDYNHVGDFCTVLTFNPTEKLSFYSFMSVDAGNNQTHDMITIRGDRKKGKRPHISGNFFNRLYMQMTYKPIPDISLILAYDYKDGYIGRPAYSMGSTLTELTAGSAFDQYYVTERTQTLNFGISMPLTPDRRTYGAYSIAYDFEEGAFTRQTLAISHLLHCVRLSATVELERERDDRNDAEYDFSFAVYATLVGFEGPMDAVNRSAMSKLSGN